MSEIFELTSQFSKDLEKSLRIFYKGRLPSFSTIARDFSLRAPHLNHVSSETIRKWLRGENLPHITRLQVLKEWLSDMPEASQVSHARCEKDFKILEVKKEIPHSIQESSQSGLNEPDFNGMVSFLEQVSKLNHNQYNKLINLIALVYSKNEQKNEMSELHS